MFSDCMYLVFMHFILKLKSEVGVTSAVNTACSRSVILALSKMLFVNQSCVNSSLVIFIYFASLCSYFPKVYIQISVEIYKKSGTSEKVFLSIFRRIFKI